MHLQNNFTEAGCEPRKTRTVLSKRVPRVGRVVFSEHSNPVHCSVKDFTGTRAVLTMSGWLGVPSDFTLYVEPDSIRAQCRVIRCKGSNVEVTLEQVEENIRFRSSQHTTV